MKSNGLIFLFLFIWGCSHSVDPEAKITNSVGESYFGKVKSIEEMNYDKNKKRLSIWKWKYQNGFIHLYIRNGLEIKAFFKSRWGEQ